MKPWKVNPKPSNPVAGDVFSQGSQTGAGKRPITLARWRDVCMRCATHGVQLTGWSSSPNEQLRCDRCKEIVPQLALCRFMEGYSRGDG